MIAAAALGLAAALGGGPDVWDDVEQLAFGSPDDEARAELLARSWEAWERATPSAERTLLEHVLARAEGGPAALPAPDAAAWPYDARRSWLAAWALPAGPARATAVAAALAELGPRAAEPRLGGARLNLAWEVWLAAALDLRFDDALAIGRPVHADQRADWSASSLALGLARAGRTDEADRVLTEQIARSSATAALWTQKGIALWGAGRDAQGRRALATGMLLGSIDASAVLARIDLAAGRRSAALAGFRAALSSDEPGPWARRAWGLAQLGPRVASPDRRW